MIVNVTTVLKKYNGDILKDEDRPGKPGKEITFRSVVETALDNPAPDEKMTPEDMAKAYRIGIHLWSDEEVDLNSDEVSFIRDRVKKVIIKPSVQGVVLEMLEVKTNKDNKSK